ncbi:MAG: class I SAM-dependent methyltransferase [Candidatus Sulfotelmatobacter sp.]
MSNNMSTNLVAEASFEFQNKHSVGKGRPLRHFVPRPVRRAIRHAYLFILDAIDFCHGRRRDLVPPRRLNFVGDGDFERIGNEFLEYFTNLGGLRPSDHILEVGSGIGRMARPLTGYLTTGSYEGLDIVPSGIRWCQWNITPRFPNFRFTLADIRNREYNRKGKLRAADFRFPYPDAHFDFCTLTSVFTHMLFADTDHYLGELYRVLRPGGRCLATFFLLNEESRRAVKAQTSSLLFRHPLADCWTTDPRVPETAVAYDETAMARLLEKNGFTRESCHYGHWSGRSQYLSFQDIVVISRPMMHWRQAGVSNTADGSPLSLH